MATIFGSDPISGIVGALLEHAVTKSLIKRLDLLFELAIVTSAAFLFFTGTALVLQRPTAFAIGLGMAAAALGQIMTFKFSQNSKGLTISLPTDVGGEKLNDVPTTTMKGNT